jgi:hypothetical protein
MTSPMSAIIPIVDLFQDVVENPQTLKSRSRTIRASSKMNASAVPTLVDASPPCTLSPIERLDQYSHSTVPTETFPPSQKMELPLEPSNWCRTRFVSMVFLSQELSLSFHCSSSFSLVFINTIVGFVFFHIRCWSSLGH